MLREFDGDGGSKHHLLAYRPDPLRRNGTLGPGLMYFVFPLPAVSCLPVSNLSKVETTYISLFHIFLGGE